MFQAKVIGKIKTHILCSTPFFSETLPFMRKCGKIWWCRVTRTHPYPITLLPIGSGNFRTKPFPLHIPQLFSNQSFYTYPPMKLEHKLFRNVAHKIQTPGNYPEENIRHRFTCSNIFYCTPYMCFQINEPNLRDINACSILTYGCLMRFQWFFPLLLSFQVPPEMISYFIDGRVQSVPVCRINVSFPINSRTRRK